MTQCYSNYYWLNNPLTHWCWYYWLMKPILISLIVLTIVVNSSLLIPFVVDPFGDVDSLFPRSTTGRWAHVDRSRCWFVPHHVEFTLTMVFVVVVIPLYRCWCHFHSFHVVRSVVFRRWWSDTFIDHDICCCSVRSFILLLFDCVRRCCCRCCCSSCSIFPIWPWPIQSPTLLILGDPDHCRIVGDRWRYSMIVDVEVTFIWHCYWYC